MDNKKKILGLSCANNDRPLMWGYIVMAVIFGASLVTSFAMAQSSGLPENDIESLRTFSVAELAAFDGKNDRPAYTSYEGLIYDVTASKLWPDGEHYGHMAGIDATDLLAGAPHGQEVLEPFPVVGKLDGYFGEGATPLHSGNTAASRRGPILILGLNLTSWTGYLLGIFLILNFTTCYVMPWCVRNVPWHGTVPGHDKYDSVILKLSYYHRYFAWLTIIFGIVHGVIGIFQSFGIRI